MMIGYYRFILACLVLISHIGITIYGFNPGVIAVISFYMLSGYVVSYLFLDKFDGKINNLYKFYIERGLRIFPLYIYIIFLSILFLLWSGYGHPHYAFYNILKNVIIIPLNYYMYIDSTILQNPKWWLIPPAWSLGVELQVYLILPFLLIFTRFRIVTFIISIFIYMFANFGILHTDYFGYRLVPGVIFIFLIGYMIYKKEKKIIRYILIGVYLLFLIIFIILYMKNMLYHPFAGETLLGVLIGLPLIYSMTSTSVRLPYNHFIGDLSYGVFLSHFLMIWINDYVKWIGTDSIWYIPYLICGSLLVSLVGILLIESSIKKYRMKLTQTI